MNGSGKEPTVRPITGSWSKKRADRGMLVSMQEQERQLAQVRINWFGETGADLEGDAATARAAAFMVSLAKDYCAD